MTTPFSEAEARYVLAWAVEDHRGLPDGPARTLQKQHGIHAAVLGQLFARLATVTGRSQYEMLEGLVRPSPITWPWQTQEALEARLKELLPDSTLRYLEELGALTAGALS